MEEAQSKVCPCWGSEAHCSSLHALPARLFIILDMALEIAQALGDFEQQPQPRSAASWQLL